MIATLATLAALAASPAPAQAPTPQVTVAGQVVAMPAPRMFTLVVGDRRVLVYASAGQADAVRVGDRVVVTGKVPADWLKLATDELQASDVQVQP